jgi:hypothetical protein
VQKLRRKGLCGHLWVSAVAGNTARINCIPSEFSIIFAVWPSMRATAELVVPKWWKLTQVYPYHWPTYLALIAIESCEWGTEWSGSGKVCCSCGGRGSSRKLLKEEKVNTEHREVYLQLLLILKTAYFKFATRGWDRYLKKLGWTVVFLKRTMIEKEWTIYRSSRTDHRMKFLAP